MKKPVRIVIADDHPLFLKGLREIIAEENEWRIAAEARDGEEAWRLIEREKPDIAILDINMPKTDGLEIARRIANKELKTAVIILTMYDDGLLLGRAGSYGVKGYILKESAVDDILEGIEAVIRGDTFVSPALTKKLLPGDAEKNTFQDIFRYKLTRMEQKIVRLIAEDHTSRDIAGMLFISPKTVENHRSNICKKLNLSGKNALLRYVLEKRDMILTILAE